MAEPKTLLAYRHKVRKGFIMKPSTFKGIEKAAMKRYHVGPERAAKIAGKAYWIAAEKKFKARHQ